MPKKVASNVVQLHPVPDWMETPCVWQVSGESPAPSGEPEEDRGALRKWLRRSLDALIDDLNWIRSRI